MKDWIKNNAVTILTLLAVLFTSLYHYGKLSSEIRSLEREINYLRIDVEDFCR